MDAINRFKIKTKKIRGNANTVENLAELINEVLEINKNGLENALNNLYEDNLRSFVLFNITTALMVRKLNEVYGVTINYDQLQKEAVVELNEKWPVVKKDIVDQLDSARKIEEIFKSLDDEQHGDLEK